MICKKGRHGRKTNGLTSPFTCNRLTLRMNAMTTSEIDEKVKQLENTMLTHAQNLEFEQAAAVRDEIAQLRLLQLST